MDKDGNREKGVWVYRQGWDGVETHDEMRHYKDAKAASVGNQGELYLVEEVADLANTNNGKPVPRVCACFAKGEWDYVELVD